jgi:hypothetical protein
MKSDEILKRPGTIMILCYALGTMLGLLWSGGHPTGLLAGLVGLLVGAIVEYQRRRAD